MAAIGIMLEGQEDLTWDRLFRLAAAVEELGFESLFRSDHLTALDGDSKRASLALWPSLTALAVKTKRIRFGPLVCSMTFRHPSLVAKMAAAVDELSGGRLELGLGAGWYEGEHRMFGLPFPPHRMRVEMLDEGAEVIRLLWSGKPATFKGRHFQIENAESYPLPRQKPIPIIMGGKNPRTLRVVAKHAAEWNFTYNTVEAFRRKSAELDGACAAAGRDPKTLRRSLMIPFVIGSDRAAAQERIDAHRRMFPSLPRTLAEWRASGFIGGAPAEVIEQLKEFEAAGVERFMLQHNDLDDLGSLEILAQEVLPEFR